MKYKSLVALLALLVSLSSAVSAHIEKTEPLQSLRQSYFALLGMTFAPMGDMVKGKIEWDLPPGSLRGQMTCITLHNFTLNVDLRLVLNKAPLEPNPLSGPTWTTSKANWMTSVPPPLALPRSRLRVTREPAESNLWQRAAPVKPVTMNTNRRTICTSLKRLSTGSPRYRLLTSAVFYQRLVSLAPCLIRAFSLNGLSVDARPPTRCRP